MAVICVFNGIYAHCEEIIDRVGKELKYRNIDQELIQKVGSQFNLSVKKIEQTHTGTLSPFSKFTNEREKNTAKIKLSLAELLQDDNLVVSGYACHLIPRSITHMLKVCVIANMDYRIKLAVQTDKLSEKAASAIIHKDDRCKSDWTDFLLGSHPYKDELYDIVIPTQDYTVEDSVRLIVEQATGDAVKTTNLSKNAAKDFLFAAKIQLHLANEGHFPEVYAEAGIVTLLINKYVYRLERYENELKKLAGKVDGVMKVITRTGSRYSVPPIMPMGEIEMPSKILLVDDEKEFIHTLSERLSTRNLESSVVYNGEEALEFIDKDEPDVMVLDLKMPGIDGIEVLRRVKKEHPNIEVIILTGHGSEREETLAEELGAFAYLHKPVNIDLLAHAMKEAYKKAAERSKGNPEG